MDSGLSSSAILSKGSVLLKMTELPTAPNMAWSCEVRSVVTSFPSYRKQRTQNIMNVKVFTEGMIYFGL